MRSKGGKTAGRESSPTRKKVLVGTTFTEQGRRVRGEEKEIGGEEVRLRRQRPCELKVIGNSSFIKRTFLRERPLALLDASRQGETVAGPKVERPAPISAQKKLKEGKSQSPRES